MIARLGEGRPLLFDEPFGEGEDRHVHVRAASAIVRLGDELLLAQDDSNFAAVLDARGRVRPLRLFPRAGADTFSTARGNKRLKPDLECGLSLRLRGRDAVVFLGSGSLDARMRGAIVTREADGLVARAVALPSLYEAALAALGIGRDVLNVEAAARVGDVVRIFQRGNGAGGVNASFDVAAPRFVEALEGRELSPSDVVATRRFDLGTIDGFVLGFSAAEALPDGRLVFAASAEDSPNTYDDGPCAGSVLGVIEPDGRVTSARATAADGSRVKLEGLVVDEVASRGVRGRCVTDSDDPNVPSVMAGFELAW